jgi:hypothetical protein
MKTVLFHRYTIHHDTQVRSAPDGPVVGQLSKNSWLGVVEEREGWYKVISAQVDGWVQMDDCYAAWPISLSAILKSPGQPIENYSAVV